MMDNPVANKNHIPCQSWVAQNGWSATSTQGSLFSPLPSSDHLNLGSSSGQRSSCDHLQGSSQSCMSDIMNLTSTHHTALYKASHSNSNSQSIGLFANTAIPGSSHNIAFPQQRPQNSSMLLNANQGKHLPPPSLPQTNQAPQPFRQLLLSSTHDPFKASFHPPLTNQPTNQPNRHQDLPMGLLSCGQQRVSTSQGMSDGANTEFAGVFGNTDSHDSSSFQDWIPSSHCHGPARGSVLDISAHLNKELQQDSEISPPDNQGRRSALLHQRAQLLQQLAELNKHLESLPTEDSSDGQCPQPVDDLPQCEQNRTSDPQLPAGESQFQAGLSADCLSSASDDGRSDTYDSPADVMSEEESMKKEDPPAKPGESSDPDFTPNCDNDLSDDQSDAEEKSADESSSSRPLTPTDEASSLSADKNTKSASSMFKEKIVSLPKKANPANLRKSAKTPVLPSCNDNGRRQYNKRNYCLYCSMAVLKMSRHLERAHSDKPEVAAAFQYPKKSKERRKIWNKLINEGNFAHNKKVLKTGKGNLVVRKRPSYCKQAEDFLHCLHCRGLFIKGALYRHMRFCPERVKTGQETWLGRKRIAIQCVLEATDDIGVSDALKSVLFSMTYNDVAQTIMDDEVILQYGELLCTLYGSDGAKHEYIRQNLRQIARLVLEAQKITPLKKLGDFFLPSNFEHVVSAVNVLAGYDPEKKKYSIPSLAIKLGYSLQKTCSIVESNALQSGDEILAESARNFLSVYEKKWNKLVSGGALSSLRETKSVRAKKVPLLQDIKRLSFHMEKVHALTEKKLRDDPSEKNYMCLVKVVLARTIAFNNRGASEISMLKLKDFLSRKKPGLYSSVGIAMSDFEKKICPFFTRIEIRAKCGRVVPIFLKPSIESAIELFVKVRDTIGITSENQFLFARPHALSSYHGSDCFQRQARDCGAIDLDMMSSSKIRKHYSTMLQVLNLDENEADQILGPNNQITALRQKSSAQTEDAESDSDEILQAIAESYCEPHGATRGSKLSRRSAKLGTKGDQSIGKTKWSEEEVLAVESHMMRFIKGHKVPQKNDCIECLEAEPEALRTRSWRGVKDYVRNRITSRQHAKKRKAGDPEGTTPAKVRKHDTPKKDDRSLGPNSQARDLQQTNNMNPPVRSEPTRKRQAASLGHNQHSGEIYQAKMTDSNPTAPRKSGKPGKKGGQNSGVHKWQEEEISAVERHMMSFIKGHKVPQKDDCVECLEAEPEALSSRSWKGIKDYVRNRITALKRQSGSSKRPSKNTNWSGKDSFWS